MSLTHNVNNGRSSGVFPIGKRAWPFDGELLQAVVARQIGVGTVSVKRQRQVL